MSLASLTLFTNSLSLSFKYFSSLKIGSDRINAYNISLLDKLVSIFLKLAISLNFLIGNTANLLSFTKSLSDYIFIH